MGKRFIFQHYWWIAIATVIIAISVILRSGADDRGKLIATTVGTALTFCYLVQKQKLDESNLFKELFADFNHRYDEMNGKLERIRLGDAIEDIETLVDYFNLCGEEYLFFKEGYIHPEVWQAWCRGMLWYLREDGIRTLWDDQMTLGSYYGLTFQAIEEGARTH